MRKYISYSNFETFTLASDLLNDEFIEHIAKDCKDSKDLSLALKEYVLKAWDEACDATSNIAALEFMHYAHHFIDEVKFDEIAEMYYEKNKE